MAEKRKRAVKAASDPQKNALVQELARAESRLAAVKANVADAVVQARDEARASAMIWTSFFWFALVLAGVGFHWL